MFSIFGKRDHVKAFWTWFADNRHHLLGSEPPDARVMSQVGTRLRKIHPGLVFEVDLQHTPRSFVVSADGNRELFPTVKDVVARAPQFDNIGVLAFRQPGPGDVSIRLRDQTLASNELWFETAVVAGGIGLKVYIPGLSASNEDELSHAAFMLTDNALGEHFMTLAIADLAFAPLPPDPASLGLHPFSEIPRLVQAP